MAASTFSRNTGTPRRQVVSRMPLPYGHGDGVGDGLGPGFGEASRPRTPSAPETPLTPDGVRVRGEAPEQAHATTTDPASAATVREGKRMGPPGSDERRRVPPLAAAIKRGDAAGARAGPRPRPAGLVSPATGSGGRAGPARHRARAGRGRGTGRSPRS